MKIFLGVVNYFMFCKLRLVGNISFGFQTLMFIDFLNIIFVFVL